MTNTPPRPKPVLLCILDGWGHADAGEHNAITLANTPHLEAAFAHSPHSLLEASAGAVGLPEGQMGNSEVGHMNIGAGRVVMQDLPKIDTAIADGSLKAHPRLQGFIQKLKASGGVCHLMGLLSDGGVHSHQAHLTALARIVSEAGIAVRIHAFLDGRDTPPKSAAGYIATLEADIAGLHAEISTLSGRYFAMDRDNRWDRVEKAYRCMVEGHAATRADTASGAVKAAYTLGQTDEFIAPVTLGNYTGMQPEDGLLMANFRADRARQLLHALIDPAFDGFQRRQLPQFIDTLGMVKYSSALAPMIDALYPPEQITNSLGEVISQHGLKQLRIAETEKYAHVTFFFNGGSELEYPGESRILIPSPNVATYDLQPEMSAPELTSKLVAAIDSGAYDLIVCNYANTDMVGHSGDLNAAIQAVEAVDIAIGALQKAMDVAGGVMLITADHGNAEKMQDDTTGQPHTAHTTNEVPLILTGKAAAHHTLKNGKLADIAPTVLRLMRLEIPAEMTGNCLLDA